jgi:hypothetical protein
VCNGNDKGGNLGKVTLVAILRVKQLKLDHVTIVAVWYIVSSNKRIHSEKKARGLGLVACSHT